MKSDLYKKSPEAEALLKGIPASLFRYAMISFGVVLLIVLGIGKWISFPVQKTWESYYAMAEIHAGLYELQLDSTIYVSPVTQPQVTVLIHRSGGEPTKLTGKLVKVLEGGFVLSTDDSIRWHQEEGEGYSTIILSEGEISLWEKLISGGV